MPLEPPENQGDLSTHRSDIGPDGGDVGLASSMVLTSQLANLAGLENYPNPTDGDISMHHAYPVVSYQFAKGVRGRRSQSRAHIVGTVLVNRPE